MPRYAEVAVPIAVHGTFSYLVPDSLAADLAVGSRVEVQLGAKLTTGFVVGLPDSAPADAAKIKPVRRLLDEEEPPLIPEIIQLCRWAADYYIAPLGEMLRVALPANMGARSRREVVLVGHTDDDGLLVAELRKRPLLLSTILNEMNVSRATIDRWRAAGVIEIRESLHDAKGVRYDRFAVLEKTLHGLPPKQAAATELLQSRGELSVRALEAAGISSAVLGALVKKGAVRIERRARRHSIDAFLAERAGEDTRASKVVGEFRYSEQQMAAIAAVRGALGSFVPFVLEGVTGSGKTEVYIEIMREGVRRGEQALLLVPEISLTPVFAARLRDRFGDRIAILHSNLSASERYDQWWRTRRGEVDVAIGPRSALFTPFERLGIIVVDEEGDGAYKQEESPRYNARDLAVVRAHLRSVPIVLGSATPSLESRENAARGKYTLLRMDQRVEARPLPAVEVIDLRKERAEKEDRGMVIFSGPMKDALRGTFASREQAIVLINRRGYAPYLLCRECGHEFRCRDCSVTLTVHRRDGLLICHYCGLRRPMPSRCPLCDGEVLQPIGFGTEKVAERFMRDFPDIAMEVLDRDSTRRKGELVRILDRFRSGATQCLIGTQMLSKGHHFPNVTLTAVLNADTILGYPDFRSAEKTFYLLTQVAGRAGRGELRGRVLIQSAFPTHYAIQHATRHDYESFYEAEVQFRRTFHYPPLTAMIALVFRGGDVELVERAAVDCARMLEEAVQPLAGTRIQGPAPAPLARIKGVWRYHVLLRSPQRAALRRAVDAVVTKRRWRGVEVVVDVDPLNLL